MYIDYLVDNEYWVITDKELECDSTINYNINDIIIN